MNDIWNVTTTELTYDPIEVTYKYELYQGKVSDGTLQERLLWVNENHHIVVSLNFTVHPHGYTMWHMLVHELHEEPVATPKKPEDEFNDYETER